MNIRALQKAAQSDKVGQNIKLHTQHAVAPQEALKAGSQHTLTNSETDQISIKAVTSLQKSFTRPLLRWYKNHGRHDLPWQKPKTAYRVWISEIMLQQTQVKTVIPYFLTFMTRFPKIQDLANATEDEVLTHWSGLGYYSRARNIHKAAQIICKQFSGKIPKTPSQLKSLPGIGDSTAAAIASLAFHQPTAITDGNVKRVLCRYFNIHAPIDRSHTHKRISNLAQACMPSKNCASYSQAIMDLGATCCTPKNAQCSICPVEKTCAAKQKNLVNQLPFKTPKRAKPEKVAQFYLLFDQQNYLLLIKRPSSGIWGGLWSIPSYETESDLNAKNRLMQDYAPEINSIKYCHALKHTFTHFHLHMQIYEVALKDRPVMNETHPCYKWVSKKDISNIGLPAPIRIVIDQFFKPC